MELVLGQFVRPRDHDEARCVAPEIVTESLCGPGRRKVSAVKLTDVNAIVAIRTARWLAAVGDAPEVAALLDGVLKALKEDGGLWVWKRGAVEDVSSSYGAAAAPDSAANIHALGGSAAGLSPSWESPATPGLTHGRGARGLRLDSLGARQ